MAHSVNVPVVKIPNQSALRSSQCVIGQGLFKHTATFDPAADDVCVEELVENIKACEDRLNNLRHQTDSAIRRPRTTSPSPSQRPAWGRSTPPVHAHSPTTTPRTQTAQANANPSTTPRTENRDRPWRTSARKVEPVHRHPSPTSAVEPIERDSPSGDDLEETEEPQKKETEKKVSATRTPSTLSARGTSAAPKESVPPNVAAKRAAQRAATYQRKSSRMKDQEEPQQQAPSSARGTSAAARRTLSQPQAAVQYATADTVNALLQRIESLETTVGTLATRNEELTSTVQSLQAENQQLTQTQHMNMTDITGKWIALSSQVQYLLMQSVGAAPAAPYVGAGLPTPPQEHRHDPAAPPPPPPMAHVVEPVPIPQAPAVVVAPFRREEVPSRLQYETVLTTAAVPREEVEDEDDEDEQHLVGEHQSISLASATVSRPTTGTSLPGYSPPVHTARRLDMSNESMHSITRLPPSPPVKLEFQSQSRASTGSAPAGFGASHPPSSW